MDCEERNKGERYELRANRPTIQSGLQEAIVVRSGVCAGEDGVPCSKTQLSKYLYRICCPPGSDDCKVIDLSILDPSRW